METRANHLWVGAVTLVLLAALAAFIVWIARLGQGQQDEFDIFYGQSVSGLANGSQVSFAGVPVGQVTGIALAKDNPEFVRVRIKVKDDVPILVGTRATIEASFTGVSTILLDGARKGAPEITCETTACPEGRPVIPPGRGGFGEIVANAPAAAGTAGDPDRAIEHHPRPGKSGAIVGDPSQFQPGSRPGWPTRPRRWSPIWRISRPRSKNSTRRWMRSRS